MKSQNSLILAILAAGLAAYYFLIYRKAAATKAAAAAGGAAEPVNFAQTAPRPGVPASSSSGGAGSGLTSQLAQAGIGAASSLLSALFGKGGGGGGGGGGGMSFGGGGGRGGGNLNLQTAEPGGQVTAAELFGAGNPGNVDAGIPFQADPTVTSNDLNFSDVPASIETGSYFDASGEAPPEWQPADSSIFDFPLLDESSFDFSTFEAPTY